jgi:2-oxoglutarate dehydrogenase E2 component (dihydrolipoamide succinyltransferase)
MKVPSLGESITEATIAKWHKKEGDLVSEGELLVELETDKVTLEVTAETNGVLEKVIKPEGEVVSIGEEIGVITPVSSSKSAQHTAGVVTGAPYSLPQIQEFEESNDTSNKVTSRDVDQISVHPAAKKLIEENNIDILLINRENEKRITKEDVVKYLTNGAVSIGSNDKEDSITSTASVSSNTILESSNNVSSSRQERVKMSRLRQTIAKRLKESQNTAAILTTFNEVDMSAIMSLRSKHKEKFQKLHEVKLGFMSFFVKACVRMLKQIPEVNAEIDDQYIIYKNHYDIGIAVGSNQGLVVPIVRNADFMTFSQIEAEIFRLAKLAKDGKLSVSDMTGGTFSITNGGTYGSMLSTPIINPPQSAILGMHNIVERAVVVDKKIEIRPIMYLALSYDHRIIDGKEAVTFLTRVKELLESPEKLLLDL